MNQDLGDPVPAGKHLRQALRLVENHHDLKLVSNARLQLGKFLAEHGSAAEAVVHLEWLVERSDRLAPERVDEAKKCLALLAGDTGPGYPITR